MYSAPFSRIIQSPSEHHEQLHLIQSMAIALRLMVLVTITQCSGILHQVFPGHWLLTTHASLVVLNLIDMTWCCETRLLLTEQWSSWLGKESLRRCAPPLYKLNKFQNGKACSQSCFLPACKPAVWAYSFYLLYTEYVLHNYMAGGGGRQREGNMVDAPWVFESEACSVLQSSAETLFWELV
jgi:uncharacterized protein YceK